ncbi:hypothetical protein HPB47_027030 [Ixodes persulcatus]|uniref:Uncharacterized protein n=1 Tax=Ixodes persulcatus TaxID=34615 RepID=A0AC60PX39_IXOPE|nr:hypothetical protein HPB47_027030 [Ixodes persulcatus]
MQEESGGRLVDSRYAWLVALTCGWVQVWAAVVFRSSGVLLVGVVADFNVTREEAAWPFELYNIVSSVQGFTTGILIHFFDTRTLTMAGTLLATMSAVACFLWNHFTIYLIFIGLGFGTSSGITVPVNVVALSRYFRLHRTSANGLNFAGASVGSFLIPPLLAGFLDRYGLGGTMLVIGALTLNAMAGGIVLRSSADYPQCRGQGSSGEDAEDGSMSGSVRRSELCSTEFLLCESGVMASSVAQLPMWKIREPRDMRPQGPASFLWQPVFYSLTLTGIVYSFVFSSYLITIVDHVHGVLGVTNQQASLLVSVMAAGDLISRLGTGCLADLGYVNCETLLVVNFAALAACYALLAHVDSLLQFGLVAFVFGLNNGGPIVSLPCLLSDHLGNRHLPMTYGIHRLSMAIGTLVRPTLIGYFKDGRGSYNGLYYLISVFSGATVFLWVPGVVRSYCKRSRISRGF